MDVGIDDVVDAGVDDCIDVGTNDWVDDIGKNDWLDDVGMDDTCVDDVAPIVPTCETNVGADTVLTDDNVVRDDDDDNAGVDNVGVDNGTDILPTDFSSLVRLFLKRTLVCCFRFNVSLNKNCDIFPEILKT